MAVVSVNELADYRRATENLTPDMSARTYQRVFLVRTDDKNDGPLVAKSDPAIPLQGDPYPGDARAFCKNKSVEPFAPPMAWHVVCEYSSEWVINPNPLNDPALISWKAEQFERPVWRDRNGFAILNSVGDFFQTLPVMDDSHFVVSVKKNLAAVPVWVATYQDAINISPFTVDGILVGTGLGKLQALNIGETQERNGIQYRVLSYDIHLREEGWDLEILDMGFTRKGDYTLGEDPTKNYSAAPRDGDQTSSESAVLLDGAGGKLSPANPLTAVFLPFSVYPQKNFNMLPLT